MKINQRINVRKKDQWLYQAKILGRMDWGPFTRYLVDTKGINLWLDKIEDQWRVWIPWEENGEIYINEKRARRKNNHPLERIITIPEGEVDGQGKDRKLILTRGVGIVKNTFGNVGEIKKGDEGDYIFGRYIKRKNDEWPLFLLESWRQLNWKRMYYLGKNVDVVC